MVLRKEELDGAFDRLSLGVATVAAVRAMGATRPVLLAVDDAQWLDHPTAKTLAFVVRRLAGTPARIAARAQREWLVGRRRPDRASRPWTGQPSWPGRCPGASTRSGSDRSGPSELSRILRRVLGWVPAWPRVVRIAELSRGNPLYALELARAFGGVRSGEELDRSPARDGGRARRGPESSSCPPRIREAVDLACVPRAPRLDVLRRLDAPSDRRAGEPGRRPWMCGRADRGRTQRHRHHRRRPGPVHPPDPGRRCVRIDSHVAPAPTAPSRGHAHRRPGGTGPSSGHRGRGAGPARGPRSRGRCRAGLAPRRTGCSGRPAALGLPADAAHRHRGVGAAADRVRPAVAQRGRCAGRHR